MFYFLKQKSKTQKQSVCNMDTDAEVPIPKFSNGRKQSTSLFLHKKPACKKLSTMKKLVLTKLITF